MKKFLLTLVGVLAVPVMVAAQVVSVNPSILNPQANTLDPGTSTNTVTLDQDVMQSETAASQTQTINPDTMVGLGGASYLDSQLQQQNPDQAGLNRIRDTEDIGNCPDGSCDQNNFAKNTINTSVDVSTSANLLQGNNFSYFGTPGIALNAALSDSDATAVSSAGTYSYSQASINAGNVLSGVGVTGSVNAMANGTADASSTPVATATSTATSTPTTTVTDNSMTTLPATP